MGAAQETRESRSQGVKKPEPELPVALRGIFDAIIFSGEDITGYNLSPEQKSKLRTIEGKIVELTPKFFRFARRAVAVGAIIAIGNYYHTHPNLKEITDGNGQVTYSHEDARTTHYLNILAGREKFTEEDVEAEIKPDLINKLREKKVPIPRDIEEMSLDDVYGLYYENSDPYKVERPEVFRNHNRQWAQMINDKNTPNSSTSKDKYKIVWLLENESGNPRIRFVAETGLTAIVSPKFKDHDKYDPVTNTVFITSGSFLNPNKEFIPEATHGKQFRDNPVGSYWKGIRDLASVAKKGRIRLNISEIEEEYENLYLKHGSLENEAHELIEPNLQKKYPLR